MRVEQGVRLGGRKVSPILQTRGGVGDVLLETRGMDDVPKENVMIDRER